MSLKHFFTKAFLIKTTLWTGIVFLGGFLYQTEMPLVRNWALMKIEEISDRHLPVRVLPTKIEFQILPLAVTLENVRVLPKSELQSELSPFLIKSVELQASLWNLIQGRLKMSTVTLSGADLLISIPHSKKSNKPPLDGLFKIVKQVPIDEILLKDVNAIVDLQEQKKTIDASDIQAAIYLDKRGIGVDIQKVDLVIGDRQRKFGLRLDIESRMFLKAESFTLSSLRVRRGESYLLASGSFTGQTENLSFPSRELNGKLVLGLSSIQTWVKKNLPEYSYIPKLKGKVSLDYKLKEKPGSKPDIDVTLEAEKLEVDQFKIGNVRTHADVKNKTLLVDELSVDSPAGQARFLNTEIGIGEPFTISSTVASNKFDFHKMFEALNLKNIPVWMTGAFKIPCQGQLKPEIQFKCTAEMKGENFLIRPDIDTTQTIVKVPMISAVGSFSVDQNAVEFKSDLQMPNSRGNAQGRVEYKTGFKVDFEATPLQIRDLANFVDLKLEGQMKIKGSTEGDSESATANMSIDGSQLWLEDYFLGQAKSQLSYKQGRVRFTGLSGHYTVSRYDGEVDIDLAASQISINGRIPFIDAREGMYAFSRRVKLPIEITGTGSAQIKAWGPFAFNLLSYDVKSTLFKGTIAGEAYDQINFDVHSRGGEVNADRVVLAKDNSTIMLTGKGHPNGNVETLIKGRQIKLEDTRMVGGSGLSLSGLFDFDMDLTGYVLAPDTAFRGRLTKTSIGEQVVPDTSIDLKFLKNTIQGETQLFGNSFAASFTLPLNESAPFALDLRTTDWNYMPVFAAISGPASRRDFEGRITSKIKLSSANGGIWGASGLMEAEKFFIRRGNISMTAPRPVKLSMKDGVLKVDNFEVTGENTFFKLANNPNPRHPIDLQFNGKSEMSLLALLAPFFEDIRGLLSCTYTIKLGPDFSELLGSAYIDKGFLKLFDFPHPFEEMKADLLFNQNKVLINSLKADFAGGRANADGLLELKGYKNYPLRLNVQLDKVNLNIPEKVKTSGSGQLVFSGQWFPFNMRGEYIISGGQFTKEFDGSDARNSLRRNFFLPEFLLQQNFTPLAMDVRVDLEKGIDIKNSLVEGRAAGELYVRGSPSKPTLQGEVHLEKDTKVFFRDTPFDVVSATFQMTDPNELNPKMYITARSRVQEYDINLAVQGTSKKPELNLTSSPPLSEPDIISLLALGVTSQKLDTEVSSQQKGNSTSYQIGSALLQQVPIGKELKDRFGVDVQFSTAYTDNTTAVQKISVSGKVTNKLGWQYNRSMGEKSRNEGNLRYRLGQNLSLVGTYEEGVSNNASTDEIKTNVLGLELEFKKEFK